MSEFNTSLHINLSVILHLKVNVKAMRKKVSSGDHKSSEGKKIQQPPLARSDI